MKGLGKYIISSGSAIGVRVPGAEAVWFPKWDAIRAIAKRDELAAAVGMDPKKLTTGCRSRSKNRTAIVKDLPPGITVCHDVLKTTTSSYYVAWWREPNSKGKNKLKAKWFGWKKYGRDDALALAIEHREQMLKEHYFI